MLGLWLLLDVLLFIIIRKLLLLFYFTLGRILVICFNTSLSWFLRIFFDPSLRSLSLPIEFEKVLKRNWMRSLIWLQVCSLPLSALSLRSRICLVFLRYECPPGMHHSVSLRLFTLSKSLRSPARTTSITPIPPIVGIPATRTRFHVFGRLVV